VNDLGTFAYSLPKDTDPQVVTFSKSQGACGTATVGAAAQSFINWAEKHPEHWTDQRNDGVETALRETWPCK